jgi:ubiquinone/menaquinone biosynthesis C-methylase UbiE
MKVGTKPRGLVEWLLVKANQIPVPLIESFSAMMNAKAILVANEIGLFNALVERPLPARVLAKHLGVSVRGVSDLADALCANGYLAREGDRFALTDVSRKWLVRSSPAYIGNMLEHVNDLWPVWTDLEEAVRKGTTPGSNYQNWLRDEEYGRMLRRHILGLRDMANFTAPEITRAVSLGRRPKQLLDIGGGHGGYSIAFCNKYPSLVATVFDLGPTTEIGRETVEREGMQGRVCFKVGDFLDDDFGGEYDAALYFNIIHNFSEEDNRRVLAKIGGSLRRGGTLVVWDMFKEKGKEYTPELQPALMALHMLVSSGGTTYPLEAVYGWLREAGFDKLRRKETRTAPGLSLIIAQKG